jgi:hypothetical protein
MNDAQFWNNLDSRLAQARMAIRDGKDARPLLSECSRHGIPQCEVCRVLSERPEET